MPKDFDEVRFKRAQKLSRTLTEAIRQAEELGYEKAVDYLLQAQMEIVRRAGAERDPDHC